MRYILLLSLLWAPVLFGITDNENRGEDRRQVKEKKFGSFHFDIGLSKFYILNSEVRKTYQEHFGNLALMPALKSAYFIHLDPFAIGLGFGLSYMKNSGHTYLENGDKSEEMQEFVYLPYNFFLDFELSLFKSFLKLDAWVGYKEAFIENRRPPGEACNCDGQVYITEKGSHWNSYLIFGGSIAFSLKSLGRERSFAGRTPGDPSDIYIKLFTEYDLDLKANKLIGGRKITKTFQMAKVQAGVAFTFEL